VRYLALAVDYDGTLATHGSVPDDVVAALERLRDTGRKVVLVTGRTLDDLRTHLARTDVFDRIVGENGAVVADPAAGEERTLAEPPPPEFVEGLRERGIHPIRVGRVIVATHEPNETAALQVIRELGIDLQVIFNKGAVMILPANVTKATGLQAALADMELSPHNVVGIGDAENDHAFLELCESSVAVANALSALRKRADVVTEGAHGEGVKQLVDWLIGNDLADLEARLKRHGIALGHHAESRKQVGLNAFGTRLVVAGSSRAGKSSLVLGLVERILSNGYQFCLVDPEGDY
jgi:HAD superfamily hydrolase (TIGR01484 family)